MSDLLTRNVLVINQKEDLRLMMLTPAPGVDAALEQAEA